MEWWLILIIVYCALTYVLGTSICLCYLIADLAAKRDLKKSCWSGALFYALISPIFMPWWIVEFIRANR